MSRQLATRAASYLRALAQGPGASQSTAASTWALSQSQQRSSTSSAASSSHEGLQVVALPKLSHQNQRCRIAKWLKQPGDAVAMYDVLMEVEADDLVEEVFKVGDFAGTVTLLVESQEEGYLAQVLVKEGPDSIPVGTPVAVFAESEEAMQKLSAAGTYSCPTKDVYDADQPQVPVLPWQSFLKSATRKVKCMG